MVRAFEDGVGGAGFGAGSHGGDVGGFEEEEAGGAGAAAGGLDEDDDGDGRGFDVGDHLRGWSRAGRRGCPWR